MLCLGVDFGGPVAPWNIAVLFREAKKCDEPRHCPSFGHTAKPHLANVMRG
jgi:hypothetical protein